MRFFTFNLQAFWEVSTSGPSGYEPDDFGQNSLGFRQMQFDVTMIFYWFVKLCYFFYLIFYEIFNKSAITISYEKLLAKFINYDILVF